MKLRLIQGDIKNFHLPIKISLLYSIFICFLGIIRFRLEVSYILLVFFTAFVVAFQFTSWILKRTYPILPDIYGSDKLSGWYFASLYFFGLAVLTYAVLFF